MENRKVAVVTGGAGYIGRATALRLAKSGINVAVCDINEESVKAVAEEISKLGVISKGYRIDVTDSASVYDVIRRIAEEFGGIDISVHVAGGSARIAGKDAKYTSLLYQEYYVIDAVLKTNLYGAMYVARAVGRIMKEQQRGGRIISFSSVVGINGLASCTEYAAAKGGVIAFTKSFAKEMGEYKVTVNSVAPGIVMRPNEEQSEQRAYNTNFLHEKCFADDIANVVNFMVSDEARFITGQTYVVDGGRSLAMKGSD